ncbi:MAG: glycosyltransferase family 39 protein [Candidatus Caldarchaeum sp.]
MMPLKFVRKIPAYNLMMLAALPAFYLILRAFLILLVWPERTPADCINPPFDGCGFIFDEAHYIPAVRKMLMGEAVNLEHPPLSKWVIMLGVSMFGDNPWGWRVPMVLFSALTIFTVGLLAKRLGGDKYVLPAQLLLFTDITFFNLGGVGILDPPALFFMTLSAYLYVSGRKALAGVAAGLSMLAKSSGILVIPTLLALEALHEYGKTRDLDRAVDAVRRGVRVFAILPLLVFFAGIAVWDSQTKAFPTPLHHLDFMLSYHTKLSYNEPWKVELPLSWIIPPISRMPSPYFVSTVTPPGYHPVAFWGVSSPLWWSVWLMVPLAYQLIKSTRIHNPSPEAVALGWFGVNFGAFAVLAYLFKRWTYSFYFLQISPILAATIPYLFDRHLPKTAYKLFLAFQILWFIMFFPSKPDWLIHLLGSLGLGEVPWI